MTEAVWTASILKNLRKLLPGAVFIKHNERISTGLPDVQVVYDGVVEFWEFKVARTHRAEFDSLLRPTQKTFCRKLAHAGAHVFGILRCTDWRVEVWRLSSVGWVLHSVHRNDREFYDEAVKSVIRGEW